MVSRTQSDEAKYINLQGVDRKAISLQKAKRLDEMKNGRGLMRGSLIRCEMKDQQLSEGKRREERRQRQAINDCLNSIASKQTFSIK